MRYSKKFGELVENFYEVERVIASLEKEPRSYNTDMLFHSNEVHTLKKIAENEGIGQKELSEMMYRTKGATSVMIDKLVKKGLVVKSFAEDDQRKSVLYLTDKGKEVNERHLQYDKDRLNVLIEGVELTEAELDVANRVIGICLESFRNRKPF